MKRPIHVCPGPNGEVAAVADARAVLNEEFMRVYRNAPAAAVLDKFASAYQARSYFDLEYAFNGLNEASKVALSRLTGIAFPKGQAASRELLRQWTGTLQEEINVVAARHTAQVDEESLRHKFRQDIAGADAAIAWIGQRLDEGYTDLRHQSKRHYLVNENGTGFDLSKKSSGLHLLRPLIASTIALRAAEAAFAAVAEPAPVQDADDGFRM